MPRFGGPARKASAVVMEFAVMFGLGMLWVFGSGIYSATEAQRRELTVPSLLLFLAIWEFLPAVVFAIGWRLRREGR